jgi:hypothetical protein
MLAAIIVSAPPGDPTAIKQSVVLGLTFSDIAAVMNGKLRIQNLHELEQASGDSAVIMPDIDIVVIAGPDQTALLAMLTDTAQSLGIYTSVHQLPSD